MGGTAPWTAAADPSARDGRHSRRGELPNGKLLHRIGCKQSQIICRPSEHVLVAYAKVTCKRSGTHLLCAHHGAICTPWLYVP